MSNSINKTKLLIIATATILIVLMVLYIILLLIPKRGTSPIIIPSPTQPILSDINSSKIEVITTPVVNDESTNVLSPESLGGDINIPEDMQNAGNEREMLIKSVPITTENFVIDYNYSILRYTIEFTNPKNPENAALFEEWLMMNYPNIGMDEFSFKN